MWRLVALTSLLLALALGTGAEAKCRMCIESISAQTSDGTGGFGKQITLRLTARSNEGAVLPESATAVVMQVDGDRTKCRTVVLQRTGVAGGLGTFAGSFNAYGQTTHSGRLDLGGEVYDFTVPLNGQPGTVQLVAFAPGTTPAIQAQLPAAVAAQAPVAPAPVAAVTAALPAAAAQPAAGVRAGSAPGLSDPDQQALLLGVGIVVFIAGTVLLERRRARDRRSGGALEA